LRRRPALEKPTRLPASGRRRRVGIAVMGAQDTHRGKARASRRPAIRRPICMHLRCAKSLMPLFKGIIVAPSIRKFGQGVKTVSILIDSIRRTRYLNHLKH
jgi:hypothetical protein